MAASPAVSTVDIVKAYRDLYRALLHTVQYSKPARYTARDKLRRAFRYEDPASFDAQKIGRTLEFLHYATEQRGLEHRIVKNILHTSWKRTQAAQRPRSPRPGPPHIRETAYSHYDTTLAMLNSSMGLCLR